MFGGGNKIKLEPELIERVKQIAEVAGYAATADAYHVAAPDPEGRGAARCMQLALDDADLAGTGRQAVPAADQADHLDVAGFVHVGGAVEAAQLVVEDGFTLVRPHAVVVQYEAEGTQRRRPRGRCSRRTLGARDALGAIAGHRSHSADTALIRSKVGARSANSAPRSIRPRGWRLRRLGGRQRTLRGRGDPSETR